MFRHFDDGSVGACTQAHRITANASLRGKQAPVQLCRQLDVAQHRQSHITWRQRPHGMSAHSPHLKSHTPIGDVTHHSSNALLLSGSSMPSGRGKSSIHTGAKGEADPHVCLIAFVGVRRHSSIRNTAMVMWFYAEFSKLAAAEPASGFAQFPTFKMGWPASTFRA
jgi:hypothetical protein